MKWALDTQTVTLTARFHLAFQKQALKSLPTLSTSSTPLHLSKPCPPAVLPASVQSFPLAVEHFLSHSDDPLLPESLFKQQLGKSCSEKVIFMVERNETIYAYY